jgi:hypothetical protein
MKKLLLSLLAISFSGAVLAGDPRAKGDVVGRDLLVPTLGWLGHVGITTSNTAVLEVLDAPFNNVIQFNSLGNFKSKSPYWGARHNGSFRNGDMIMWKGYEQSGKVDYTRLGAFSPSVFQNICVEYESNFTYNCKKRVMGWTRGKFRCDTFVGWVYSSTGNGTINGGFPKTLFSNLRYAR